jgi:hypothetical protein
VTLLTLAVAAVAQQPQAGDTVFGTSRGECMLGDRKMTVEFEVVKNPILVGTAADAILRFFAKGGDKSPLGSVTMRGEIKTTTEPQPRSAHPAPPKTKRRYDFRAYDFSETFGGRFRLTLEEEGFKLIGTLALSEVKGTGQNPSSTPIVLIRIALPVDQNASNPSPTQAPEQVNPTEITGVYEGSYIANKRQFSLELTVSQGIESNALSAVFILSTGGASAQALGSYKLEGEINPSTHQFQLRPGEWINSSGGFTKVTMQGVFEPSTGKLQGEVSPEKGTFDLARDAQKTAQLQAKIAADKKRLNEVPVALADAKSDDERRLVIVRWFSRLKMEYPGIDLHHTVLDKLYPKTLNLFGDDDFAPVFGKAFDSMTPDDRRYIMQLLRRLFNGRETRDLLDGFGDSLSRPFLLEQGSFSYADVAPQIAFRRGVHKKWREAIERLETTPSSSTGYDQIESLESDGDKEFVDLWPSDIKRFQNEVDSAKHRVAEGALKERMDAALAKATEQQNVVILQKAMEDEQELFQLVPQQARAGIDQQIDATLTGLIEKEEGSKPISGTGLVAVVAGNDWYKRLNETYGFARDRAPVQEALERLGSRRAADLSGGAPAILAEIAQQQSESGMKRVKEMYLRIPGDENTDAGRQINDAVKTRQAVIKREASLASFSPNERKLLQPDGSIMVPNPIPQPDEEDLRVAVVRTLEKMGGKRVDPYIVHWSNTLGQKFGFYIIVRVEGVKRASCSAAGSGFTVGYTLQVTCSNPPNMQYGFDSMLGNATAALITAFKEQLAPEEGREDRFELSASGWWSPSMQGRGIVSGNAF